MVEPKAEKNYRLLQDGEIVLSGDEVWVNGIGPWKPSCIKIGYQYNSSWAPFRRKIPTIMQVSEDGSFSEISV